MFVDIPFNLAKGSKVLNTGIAGAARCRDAINWCGRRS